MTAAKNLLRKKKLRNRKKTTPILEARILQLLVFLAPSQLAKHFWPSWSFIFGIRVDYLSPSLYLTDTLVFFLFLSWFLGRQRTKKESFLPQDRIWLLFFLFFILLNLVFSTNFLNSLLSWLKVLEFVFLFYYLVRVNKLSFSDWFLKPASWSLFFFGLLAVIQFFKGKSVGSFFYWLGERNLSTVSFGVALTSLFGRVFLRAYSTFPHPNVLAGYFAVSLILIFGTPIEKPFWVYFKKIILVFGFFVFCLSFSRNAFLSLFFAILLINWEKYFQQKKVVFILVGIIFLFSLSLLCLKPGLEEKVFLEESVQDRVKLIFSAAQVFNRFPLVGVGLNNFIPQSIYSSGGGSFNYQLQPVHNIYLLVLTELGLVGFLLFYLFWVKILEKTVLNGKKWCLLALLFVIISGISDHYWLTLNQSRFILTFLLGESLRKESDNGNRQ